MPFVRILACTVCILLLACCGKPQAYPLQVQGEDELFFTQYLQRLDGQKFSDSQLIIETARCFLGHPYGSGLLSKDPKAFAVNFQKLDCMTLVETVMALSFAVRKNPHPDIRSFTEELRMIRFREGAFRDFTKRYIYPLEWIVANEAAGKLKDITQDLGGIPRPLSLSIFSERYLKEEKKPNPNFLAFIKKKEAELSAYPHYFIPTKMIPACLSQLRPGDIIHLESSRENEEIVHMGFYLDKPQPTLLHASFHEGKIIVESKGLIEYLNSRWDTQGIVVNRILLPNQ